MKLFDWQKDICADRLAQTGWEKMTARVPDAQAWTELPESMRKIQRESAARLLEPIWPILESESP